MGSFSIRHEFDCSVDTFWHKIFINQDFNRRLYTNELAFDRYEIIEDGFREDGKFYREVRVQPKAEVPALLKKALGDALTYLEKGVWDPNDQQYRYEVVPSRMADRVTIDGTFWTEALGDTRCARICDMNIQVKVFGVGKLIEGFVENTTRESYEAATRVTRDFIAEEDLSKH